MKTPRGWLKLWLSLPATLLLFAAAAAIIPACRADEEAYHDDALYNKGDLGRYVTQNFHTTKHIAPRLNINLPFTGCDDGSYIFIAPRGNVPDATLYILDAEGHMVWTLDKHFGEVYNFAVQEYRGQPYLTFWAGNDAVGGHGEGNYYMYGQNYEQYKIISGANGIGADLHSFTITTDNTAVASLYEPYKVDLSGVRGWDKGTYGYVWDALFQEIDIETGEALFQWRASDHIDFRESYVRVNQGTHGSPWDFFHINTIEKDAAGNFLVSARHLRSVLYVSGETGEVLWRLGGKKNSFEDLSTGEASSFVGQHDVHWFDEEHKAITMFDNGADWGGDTLHGSIGLKVGVDLEKMTTWVEQTYKHPKSVISASQGSYQTLPNGHVVLGYGFNGVVSEFDGNGTILCDAYFEPSIRFTSGDVQSYKNLKFNWTGWPKTDPALVSEDGNLFVSWMGATEVKTWMFEDSYDGKHDWRNNDLVSKNGFETKLELQDRSVRRFVRVVALDQFGSHLGQTVVDIGTNATDIEGQASHSHEDGEGTTAGKQGLEGEKQQASQEQYDDDGDDDSDIRDQLEDMQILIAFGFLAVLSGCLVAWMTWGRRWPWQKISQQDDDDNDDEESGSMNKMPLSSDGSHGDFRDGRSFSGGLWEKLKRPKWWKGRQGRDARGEMLSSLELSDAD